MKRKLSHYFLISTMLERREGEGEVEEYPIIQNILLQDIRLSGVEE
jgi:hypothetical protein